MKKPLQLHLLKRVPPACKGGEDHEVARGAADWRSGPRWSILSVLCPVHPFPLRGTSPQGETRDMREKTASHILQVPFRRFPPLAAGATTFPHSVVGLWMLSRGAMSLQESIERFILPPEQGEVRRSRKGGGERSEPIRRMLFMPYDTESKSRNADFISIARRAIHNPRPEGPSNLRTLRPSGRSILRTFPSEPFEPFEPSEPGPLCGP